MTSVPRDYSRILIQNSGYYKNLPQKTLFTQNANFPEIRLLNTNPPSPKPQAPSPKPQAPSPKPQAPSPKPQNVENSKFVEKITGSSDERVPVVEASKAGMENNRKQVVNFEEKKSNRQKVGPKYPITPEKIAPL
jgi:hypothetical protein